MQGFIDFLVGNYEWFLIISLILIFALIGYLVDTNERKNNPEYIKPREKKVKETDEQKIEKMSQMVSKENKSLSEVMTTDPAVNELPKENPETSFEVLGK